MHACHDAEVWGKVPIVRAKLLVKKYCVPTRFVLGYSILCYLLDILLLLLLVVVVIDCIMTLVRRTCRRCRGRRPL
jgi:hypothetical protein